MKTRNRNYEQLVWHKEPTERLIIRVTNINSTTNITEYETDDFRYFNSPIRKAEKTNRETKAKL